MAGELLEHRPLRDVDHGDRAIGGAEGQMPLIGQQSHHVDAPAVRVDLAQHLARLAVEHADGAVIGGGEDPACVLREGDGVEDRKSGV